MKKEEALELFKERDVKPQHKQLTDDLEHYYYEHLEDLKKELIEGFDGICRAVRLLQEKNEQGEIGYMVYTLLRTGIAKRDYRYTVKIYNELWYLDTEQKDAGFYGAEWAFGGLSRLWDKLLTERKKYIGKLTESDVGIIIQQLLEPHKELVFRLMEACAPELICLESYKQMKKKENFLLLAGEYQDRVKLVINAGDEERKEAEVI